MTYFTTFTARGRGREHRSILRGLYMYLARGRLQCVSYVNRVKRKIDRCDCDEHFVIHATLLEFSLQPVCQTLSIFGKRYVRKSRAAFSESVPESVVLMLRSLRQLSEDMETLEARSRLPDGHTFLQRKLPPAQAA